MKVISLNITCITHMEVGKRTRRGHQASTIPVLYKTTIS